MRRPVPREPDQATDAPRARTTLLRRLLVLVAVPLAVAAGAVIVASHSPTPAQLAANARPPAPTVLTASVRYGVLTNSVVFRADVADANPSIAGVPASVGSDGQVITEMAVRPGDTASDGQLVAEVSTRPIFLAVGAVPAFRQMQPGTSGIDVLQLQRMLTAQGLFYGNPSGIFGAGTAAALRTLYSHSDARIELTSPDADAQLSAARDKVSADLAALAKPKRPAGAAAQLKADRAALDQLNLTVGPVVPLGEVVFVPSLPSKVLSTGGGVGTVLKPGASVASVGSGQVIAQGGVDSTQLQGLKVGRSVVLDPGTSLGAARTYPGTISAIAAQPSSTSSTVGPPQTMVTVRVNGPAPALVGTNVAVRVTLASSNGAVDIVPLAAVSTAATGSTAVTVVLPGGSQIAVPVRVLLTTDAGVAVAPLSGRLVAGDRVALGSAPAPGP